MKHDENLPIDPELEARIVAWVLGECSPFEAAELERRVAENPALSVFKRRIEAVHGLVGQATKPVPAKLKLSADRREKLLATIGVPAGDDAGTVMALKPLGSERSRRFPIWLPAIAACLVVGFVVFQTSKRYEMQMARSEKPYRPDSAAFQLSAPEVKEEHELERVQRIGQERERLATINAKKREKRSTAVAPFGSQVRDQLHPVDLAVPAEPESPLQEGSGETRPINGAVELSRVPPAPLQLPAASGSILNSAPIGEVTFGGNVPASITVNGRQFVTDEGTSTLAFGRNLSTWSYYNSAAATAPSGSGSLAVTRSPGALDESHYVDNDNDLVKLSPFEVKASPEQGYMASSTLAGTRISPNLKDISIPLSVTTTAALSDRASKPQRRSFGYSTATPPKPEDSISFLAGGSLNSVESDQPVVHKAAGIPAAAQTEKKTKTDSVSTFSLHVSDVSFRLAQAALERGERPDPASIRPEEFYNAFDYGDPAPAAKEPVACRIEQAAHPFLQQRNLVRIAVRVPAVGRAAAQPLRLTLLIDTSGSMEREDRTASVQRAFEVLASLLGPNDQVTLIGFARQPRLLAERVRGNEAGKLGTIVQRTPAEGGTNLEEALKLAGEKARAQFDPNAQNRIVVLSDGAANLGNDDPVALSNAVAALRADGISFDACGIGVRGLDDSILESLTRKGDGRYYVINSPDEADAGFARKLAGALHPAAQNVKVQVRFNPARVQSYRLIGFEQHRLREEDFRNDKVNAAELAGDEAAVALYDVQPNPDGEGELGEVFVRFRDTATGSMVERSWTALYDARAPAFTQASPSMQLAGSAAVLAEKLQGGDAAKAIHLSELAPVVNAVRAHYAQNRRIQDFVTMFGEARRLFGE